MSTSIPISLNEKCCQFLIRQAEFDAEILSKVLDIWMPTLFPTFEKPFNINSWVLLALKNWVRVKLWEKQEMPIPPRYGLPNPNQILISFFENWVRKPSKENSKIREVKRIGAIILQISIECFSWDNFEKLNGEFFLNQIEEKEVESLSQFLWKYRHLLN